MTNAAEGTFKFEDLREQGWAGHFKPIKESELAKPLVDISRLTIQNVWVRPGLTTREHFLCHIGMMAALNRPHELREHLRGALANGVTAEQIVDVILHVACYAGMPAAADAMLLLLEVKK